MGLGVVGGEIAWWAAESVVEGDGSCEGGEAPDESCSEGVQGAGAVAFDGQNVFGGPEDALDALADRGEVWSSSGFVFAARANDCRVQRVDLGLEVFAGVALVADDDDMARAVNTVRLAPIVRLRGMSTRTGRIWAFRVNCASRVCSCDASSAPCAVAVARRRVGRGVAQRSTRGRHGGALLGRTTPCAIRARNAPYGQAVR
jgi:hypothetical protein